MADPKVIYLAPECCTESDFGRTWAEDQPWECECGKDCKSARYRLEPQQDRSE